MGKRSPIQRFNRHMAALNDRADWLTKRVKDKPLDALHYDRAELAALRFAIEVIEENPEAAMRVIKWGSHNEADIEGHGNDDWPEVTNVGN